MVELENPPAGLSIPPPEHLVTVKIDYDGDIESPTDHDGQWTLVSFNNNHVNSGSPDDYLIEVGKYVREVYGGRSYERWQRTALRPANIGLARKFKVGTAFILSYFEHGNCVWSLTGEGPQCQWDSVSVAGVLLWEHPVKELGAKTYEERAKDARRFLESYTDWCNGNGLYYSIEDGDEDNIDSCGGYYASDSDYMVNDNIIPALEHHMERQGLTKYEIIHDGEYDMDEHTETDVLYVFVTGDASSYFPYNAKLNPKPPKPEEPVEPKGPTVTDSAVYVRYTDPPEEMTPKERDALLRAGEVALNGGQGLFIIPHHNGKYYNGYTCYGFDNTAKESRKLIRWLGLPVEEMPEEVWGKMKGYRLLGLLRRMVHRAHELGQYKMPGSYIRKGREVERLPDGNVKIWVHSDFWKGYRVL